MPVEVRVLSTASYERLKRSFPLMESFFFFVFCEQYDIKVEKKRPSITGAMVLYLPATGGQCIIFAANS
ncbi:hypothetical protein BS614_10940 [Paenibacillus xylanexedens]|nr:hypothetical protein BS614_10940 [Paenibacillus xylanexedens]